MDISWILFLLVVLATAAGVWWKRRHDEHVYVLREQYHEPPRGELGTQEQRAASLYGDVNGERR